MGQGTPNALSNIEPLDIGSRLDEYLTSAPHTNFRLVTPNNLVAVIFGCLLVMLAVADLKTVFRLHDVRGAEAQKVGMRMVSLDAHADILRFSVLVDDAVAAALYADPEVSLPSLEGFIYRNDGLFVFLGVIGLVVGVVAMIVAVSIGSGNPLSGLLAMLPDSLWQYRVDNAEPTAALRKRANGFDARLEAAQALQGVSSMEDPQTLGEFVEERAALEREIEALISEMARRRQLESRRINLLNSSVDLDDVDDDSAEALSESYEALRKAIVWAGESRGLRPWPSAYTSERIALVSCRPGLAGAAILFIESCLWC